MDLVPRAALAAAALLALGGCGLQPDPPPTAAASRSASPLSTPPNPSLTATPPGPSATGGPSPTPGASEPSSATPSARDLYAASRAASLAAPNGTVEGSVVEEGESVGILVRGNADGTDQRFDLTAPGKGTVGVVTVDGRFFLTGPVVEVDLDGVPAYRFDLPEGERMFVARDGNLVLRWTRTGAQAESLTFRDWGATPAQTLPPASSILRP